jgi:hypothetical protein
MSLRFSRNITVAAFAGDADPNVSEPLEARTVTLGQQLDGGRAAKGHVIVGAFDTDEPTGTATFRTWWKDDAVGQWFIMGQDTLVHRKRQVTVDIVGGTIFVQVLAFANAGAATTFTVRVGEF